MASVTDHAGTVPGPAIAAPWPFVARLRKGAIGFILPLAIVIVWQLSATDGALFGGALPSPARVWNGWLLWAFGPQGMGLNPYSGTWWDNVLFSTIRVAKGFALAIVIGSPRSVSSFRMRGMPARIP